MGVEDNMRDMRRDIESVCRAWGRDAAEVALLAVSKTQPDAAIKEALDAGQRLFGENRVQEAQAHWQDIIAGGAYPDLCLHLIGALQTNKVKDAVALFDVIQTVDREKLARALANEMAAQRRDIGCYIQVNTGEEPQKAGIMPQDLDAFYAYCVDECGLRVLGLMCIPPVDAPAALHFGMLRNRARALGLCGLSMGMSADYRRAIPLGATIIRIGTAIFGEREVTK